MQTRVGVLSLIFGIAVIASSSAQDAVIMPSDEYVSLFTSYCLQKFPDDGALTTDASTKGSALTPAEVKRFLHDDPGQGWTISGLDTKYILTNEAPPYHACALRHQSPQPINGNPFFTAAKAYVTTSGGSLGPLQSRRLPGANGMSTFAVQALVLDAKGQPTTEGYIFLEDNYPAVTRPDGSQTPHFYDIRFVRQIQRK